MGFNDVDTQIQNQIRTLSARNELSSDALASGVAAQIVQAGLGSLSWKERFVFLGRVVPLLRTLNLPSYPSATKVLR